MVQKTQQIRTNSQMRMLESNKNHMRYSIPTSVGLDISILSAINCKINKVAYATQNPESSALEILSY
jgi:hypothetical protein